MVQPYTRNLGSYAGVDQADVRLYTCPDGILTVVRDIVVANRSAAAAQIIIYIPTGLGNVWVWRPYLAGQSTDHLELRQVLNPGEQLKAQPTTSTSWTIAVTGYQLTL